ncbi:MAG: helix-turn-helix domain-containing protein [Chloroflexi bacterium]|nr:helix-turn-helix domain-containing protein [Chloroflexota bacterium]
MKAYSQDLQQRVLRAIDAGQSQAQVAETFAVSVATIKRYLKQQRETGHVMSKAITGRPAVRGGHSMAVCYWGPLRVVENGNGQPLAGRASPVRRSPGSVLPEPARCPYLTSTWLGSWRWPQPPAGSLANAQPSFGSQLYAGSSHGYRDQRPVVAA